MIKTATLNLPELGLGEGTHIITARSKASGYKDSADSEPIKYTVASGAGTGTGTAGLAYTLTVEGLYTCTGIGTATEPDIVIASEIDGIVVKSIAPEAFATCTNITRVTIPDGVTSIGDSAFDGCTALTGVYIPDSVASIGLGAFAGCTSLEQVALGNLDSGLTEISDSAFRDCRKLDHITIPEDVTSIGTNAFQGCIHLNTVTMLGVVTHIGIYAFDGCDELATVNYAGTEDEWENISINYSTNAALLNAKKNFKNS